MFLVLSSDLKMWNIENTAEILLLGEWCRTQETNKILANRPFKIVPYHWLKKRKVIEDTIFLKKTYEKWIPLIAEQLNVIHTTAYSTSYWEVMIGPWFSKFLCAVFDKYKCIKNAIDTNNISNVLIYQYRDHELVPNDLDQYVEFSHEEPWNTYIFTLLIHFLKNIPYQEIENFNYNQGSLESSIKEKSKLKFKYFINAIYYFFSKRKTGLFIYGNKLNLFERALMQVLCKQAIFLKKEIVYKLTFNADSSLRKKLFFSYQNEFENFLAYLLPIQIPKCYLEGYQSYQQFIKNKFPKEAKIILISEWIYGDEAFKIWLAQMKEKGAKLYLEQHGGCYGISQLSISEYYELRVADKYLTWGWKSGQYANKLCPCPSIKLSKIKRKIKTNQSNNGKVLLTLVEQARYTVHVDDRGILGPNFLDYIKNISALLDQLEEMLQGNFHIKLYPAERGWEMKTRLAKHKNNFLPHDMDLYTALNHSALHVSTYNGTTFLETFTANYPTLLYWPESMASIRNSAKQPFDELEKLGILHRDSISLGNKLSEVKNNIQEWWRDNDRQYFLKEFCKSFALSDDKYFSILRKELKKDLLEL
ncbi:MAG: hypothetical protein A3E87_05000 [Gammaproteobacteria bacterium RIFCSPHIGHO2_12_FULL_35_23]|nr:MAG: hypothetical protein A3E87_05000 [Gammaproteobacteria bacterium RIFCSPHIGHO2_12_FULL_35_23]